MIVADAEVEVHADVRPFAREARAGVLGSLRGFSPRVQVTVQLQQPTARAVARLTELRTELDALDARNVLVDLNLRGQAEALAQLRLVLREVNAVSGQRATVQVDVDGDRGVLQRLQNLRTALNGLSDVARIGRVLLPLGALTRAVGAGFVVLAGQAGIGALVPAVAGAVAALSSLSGGLLVLPAAGLAAATVFGTLTVGLLGFGDALKNLGDPEKLAESLEDMAPAAQEVVLALRDLAPAFQALRLDVQGALFSELGGMVADLGARALPVLRDGMVDVAWSLGNAAAAVIRFAGESATLGTVTQAFGVSSRVVDDLAARALPGVLTALRTVVSAGLPFIEQLGTAVTTGLAQLTQGITVEGVTAGIESAIATARQLGAVLADVGGILRGVFSAASAGAGNPLGALGVGLDQLNAWVNSPAGQGALTSIFAALAQAVTAIVPVIGAVLTALGPLLTIFANLATAAAPFVTTLLGSLAPALTSLAPAATSLGTAFGTFVAQLAPVMPQIAAVAGVLAGVLGQALLSLAPAVQPVVAALLALVSAAAPLVPVIASLAASILTGLAAAITAIPVDALTVIVAGLAGLAAVTGIVTAVTAALSFLGPAIAVVRLAWLGLSIAFAVSPLGVVVIAIGLLVAALVVAYQRSETFRAIVQGAFEAVRGAVAAAVGAVVAALAAVGAALVRVASAALSAMTRFGSAVSSGVSTAVGFLRGLPGRAVAALSALAGQLSSVASRAMSAMGRAISSGVSSAVSGLRSLAGRAVAATGNLGSALVGVGGDLMRGLGRGITGAADAAIGAARSAAARVKSAVAGYFRVGSPSRMFADIGRDLQAGLALGITQNTARAVAAAVASSRKVAVAAIPTVKAKPGAVTLGEVSAKEWQRLMALGWRGRAGDKAERLYAPAPVDRARVTAAAFAALRRAGWTANSRDRYKGDNERLYAPTRVTTVNMPGPVSRDLTERDVLDVLRIVDTLVPET